MYEIVVGRTPFEENEEEQFLTREALEVYCALLSYLVELKTDRTVTQMLAQRLESSTANTSSLLVRSIELSRSKHAPTLSFADFEDLIQLMVKPRVSERVSSCGKALQHRFFTPPELKAKACASLPDPHCSTFAPDASLYSSTNFNDSEQACFDAKAIGLAR